MKTQEQIAYHEAGHAVMYILTGRKFEYITIVPGVGEDGVKFNGMIHSTDNIAEGEKYLVCVHSAMGSMAGIVAEEILLGKTVQQISGTDYENAKTYARLLQTESEEEVKAFIAWIAWRCDGVLRKNWKEVKAIAEGLLNYKTIRYDQLVIK